MERNAAEYLDLNIEGGLGSIYADPSGCKVRGYITTLSR